MYYKFKNRNDTPPNGWIVRIKKIKSESRFWDFNSAVNWYVEFAAANPSLGLTTDRSIAADIIDQMNAARVARIVGGDNYVILSEGSVLESAIASTAPTVKTCCGAKRK